MYFRRGGGGERERERENVGILKQRDKMKIK